MAPLAPTSAAQVVAITLVDAAHTVCWRNVHQLQASQDVDDTCRTTTAAPHLRGEKQVRSGEARLS